MLLPQVEDLKQSMAVLHREREEELGHSGDYAAHLAVRLQEREAEVHQLTQEVALCREEAARIQRAHDAACQQIQHLTAELDQLAEACYHPFPVTVPLATWATPGCEHTE